MVSSGQIDGREMGLVSLWKRVEVELQERWSVRVAPRRVSQSPDRLSCSDNRNPGQWRGVWNVS